MTRKVFIIVILIILVTQKNLCEIRLRTGVTEVAVSMACSALK
ncbi:Hok/Gef family protein [Pantoea sp. AS-PWVM4]|nr:Hok/Gef family protein [Pantoea sp. AS-PWVM4]